MRKLILALGLLLLCASGAEAANCNSYPYSFTNGLTADAGQVNANFASILTCANASLAHNGANIDITSLGGMTTPLSTGQGGTGSTDGTLLLASGMIMPYAGSSAPTGWLLCYGQAVSRTTYAALFAVVGTTYGAGDGSTTFNVPDLRGYAVAGADNMGGTAANRLQATTNLTTTGSSTSATVASATGIAAGMTVTGTNITVGTTVSSIVGTTVTLSQAATGSGTNSTRFSSVGDAQALGSAGGTATRVTAQTELPAVAPTITIGGSASSAWGSVSSGGSLPLVTSGAASGQTNIPVNIGSLTATSSNLGSGSAHAGVQPTFVLNYIIKT